jgi:hypothetical protein
MGQFGPIEGYETGDGDGLSSTEAALMPCIDTSDPALCNFEEEEADGGCFVTGIGHIGDALDHPGAGRANQDSFGGNAMGMRDGRVRGQWQNTTHIGDVFHGSVSWLRCWRDDGLGPEVPVAIPNNAEWGGIGKWNHEDGYAFRVHAADRAEGGSHMDEYEIFIWNPAGDEMIYSESDIIDGGNFQIHPPNAGHPYETDYTPEPGDTDYFAL